VLHGQPIIPDAQPDAEPSPRFSSVTSPPESVSAGGRAYSLLRLRSNHHLPMRD
jgi:hypothetical protein